MAEEKPGGDGNEESSDGGVELDGVERRVERSAGPESGEWAGVGDGQTRGCGEAVTGAGEEGGELLKAESQARVVRRENRREG